MTTEATVHDFYAAAARGDLAALLAAVTDDLLVEEPSELPYAGTYHGKAGFLHMLTAAAEIADFTSLRIERLLTDDHGAVVVLRLRDRHDGGDILVAEESTVRDGKIARLRIYRHSPSAHPSAATTPQEQS